MKQFKMNERQRFSIRKFSIGAASVLLGSVFFVANPATEVQAAETQSNVEVVNNSNRNSETLKSDGQSSNVIVAPVDNTSQPQSVSQGNTVKPKNTKESDFSGKVENREAEKPKVVLNTKKLEDLLSEIDKLNLSNYTEESVKVLEAKVAQAKEVLISATTQKEIDSAYNALVGYKNSGLKRVPKLEESNTPKLDTTGGKETVGKKAENTEPNATNIAGHNHSLNGTSLPEGSGFRATPEESNIDWGYGNDYSMDGTFHRENKKIAYLGDLNRLSKNIVIKSTTGDITSVTASSSSGHEVKLTNIKNSGKQYTARAIMENTPAQSDVVITLTINIKGETTKTVQLGANRLLGRPTIKVPESVNSSIDDYLKDKVGKKPKIDVEIPKIPLLPSYAKLKVYLVQESDRDTHVYNGDDFSPNGNPRFGAVTARVDVSTRTTNSNQSPTTITIEEKDYEKALGAGKIYALSVIEINDALEHNPGTRASSFSAGVTVGPAKAAAPAAPTVARDEAKAEVKVTPSANADKVEISIGSETVVATKTDTTWTLSPEKAGVSIDGTSGVVTISHNAAAANTSIKATAKQGNSDASDSSATVTLPAKAAAPAAPTVARDEAKAEVKVTPSANADKVEISIGSETVVATKTDTTWTLSPEKAGVSIDGTSGVVTISHNAASAGTQVSATAKHGNSEVSASSTPVSLPARRYYLIPDSYNATPQPSTPTQPDQGATETPTAPSEPAPQPSQPTAPSQPASPAPAPSSAPTQAPRVAASPSASSTSTQAPSQEQVDKSELRALSQELDQRLKALATVSDPKIDAAKAILRDAQKALEDSALTEQGLRTAVESVKAALDSLKDVKENASDSKPAQDKKDAKQGTEDSKDSDKMTEANSVPAGVIVVGLLALLGVIAFWLVRRKKESEIQQLSAELTKVLGQLDAEKADKKVLAKAQNLLQETLDFVKEENGSAETEAKLVEELKVILAKLK